MNFDKIDKNYFDKEFDQNNIDLKILLNIFLRNKFLVLSITLFTTLSTIIYSYVVKPVWAGSFNIVIKERANNNNLVDSLNSNILRSLAKSRSRDNKTQELILKSPSVLMPVYKYVNKYESAKDKNFNPKSFKRWIKDGLDIKFEKDSNVLKIRYENNDKKLILNVLNKISNEYQNYSKQDREKQIINTLDYLDNQQKIMSKKSSYSLKTLNKFNIENGLGDIDGFVSLDRSDVNLSDGVNINELIEDFNSNLPSSNINNIATYSPNSSLAGQRFKKQFAQLEQYEAQYLDLSSKLKDNSKYLNELKNKISKYRSSLQRPNEILLKFKELKNEAERDQNLLINIEKNLEIIKLEKVKSPTPWQLISIPTLEDFRVSPRRSILTIQALLIGLLGSFIFAVFKEKKSKKVYELQDIKNKLSINYVDTIYISSIQISLKLINEIIIDNSSQEKNLKICIINLSSFDSRNLKNKFSKYKNLETSVVTLNDNLELEEYNQLLVFIESGMINLNDIIILNKLNRIKIHKFIGWFSINPIKINN
tara:strand:- start:1390 stop:3000 length:1611 start_codon:yes stop_codon:yes gene_type:complete